MAFERGLIEFPSREVMAERLAEFIEYVAVGAISERSTASLAVSGGSTPTMLHMLLSQRNLSWPKIDVTLVDERWVRPGAKGSNETFVQETLLQECAEGAHFEGLWSDAATPEIGASIASERVAKIRQPLDVAILGMGPDGHTASWFPHANGLDKVLSQSSKPVVYVKAQASDVTGALVDRLTLNLNMIASARLIILIITGDDKRDAFNKAMQPGPVENMPVRAILRARPNLWACWAP